MHRTPRIWLRDLGGDSFRKVLTAQVWEPEVDSPELRWRSQAETKWFLQFAGSQPSLLSELCVHERLCLRKKKNQKQSLRKDKTQPQPLHSTPMSVNSTAREWVHDRRGEENFIASGRVDTQHQHGEDFLGRKRRVFFAVHLKTSFPVSRPISYQCFNLISLQILLNSLSHPQC